MRKMTEEDEVLAREFLRALSVAPGGPSPAVEKLAQWLGDALDRGDEEALQEAADRGWHQAIQAITEGFEGLRTDATRYDIEDVFEAAGDVIDDVFSSEPDHRVDVLADGIEWKPTRRSAPAPSAPARPKDAWALALGMFPASGSRELRENVTRRLMAELLMSDAAAGMFIKRRLVEGGFLTEEKHGKLRVLKRTDRAA